MSEHAQQRPGTQESITVVIPVFNKAVFLPRVLASVIEATHQTTGVELIIVNHGSTDGSREIAESVAPPARVIEASGGTISTVRNLGASSGTGSLICFLDADVLIPHDHFSRVLEVFAESGAGAVGCECAVPEPGHWIERVWYRLNVRTTDGDRKYINSANIAVRRAVFEAVGGFPDDLATSEDVELCRRLIAAGERIYQSSRLRVTHLDNPRSLRAFMAKSYWHGLGAVRASPRGRLNRTTTFALAHLLVVVAVALVWTFGPRTAGTLLLGFGSLWLLPSVAYVFRLLQTRRVVNPITSLLLLQVWLLARGTALGRAVVRVR